MTLQRDWITPITMGAFGLLAATGVLMFFHLDSGLNETAHQWLSWVLLGGVALHAAVNWAGVRRHLAGWKGRAALGVFATVLALSFVPLGGKGEPPFLPPVRALADAPHLARGVGGAHRAHARFLVQFGQGGAGGGRGGGRRSHVIGS